MLQYNVQFCDYSGIKLFCGLVQTQHNDFMIVFATKIIAFAV